jgi:hypothetical protein
MDEVVEEVVETVASNIEDAVETVTSNLEGRFFVFGLGVGLITGGAVGWFASRARYKRKYEKASQEEIAEMRTFFRDQQKATEARLKAPLTEVVEYLGYKKTEDQPSPTEPEQHEVAKSIENAEEERDHDHNVFDTSSDHTWDYATETKLRAANPGRPFVIHLDEYGEAGFNTVCYTYYVDDDILADERDEVVDNVAELVGLENLNRFGHGTDNVNILLVRNEALEVDIEIAKANGNYAADVHGFLQHNYAVEKMPKRHQGFDDDAE